MRAKAHLHHVTRFLPNVTTGDVNPNLNPNPNYLSVRLALGLGLALRLTLALADKHLHCLPSVSTLGIYDVSARLQLELAVGATVGSLVHRGTADAHGTHLLQVVSSRYGHLTATHADDDGYLVLSLQRRRDFSARQEVTPVIVRLDGDGAVLANLRRFTRQRVIDVER